jgi:hypothetical protein
MARSVSAVRITSTSALSTADVANNMLDVRARCVRVCVCMIVSHARMYEGAEAH